MADDRSLPGWPTKKLVKAVRRQLAHYGIRPTRLAAWRTTWIWADAIARSYWQTHWPLPSEIASQYILLLLGEMNQVRMLKLPFRADKVLPAEVAAALENTRGPGLLRLGEPATAAKSRRRSAANPAS